MGRPRNPNLKYISPGNIKSEKIAVLGNTHFNGTKISSSALTGNCPFCPRKFVVFLLMASKKKKLFKSVGT